MSAEPKGIWVLADDRPGNVAQALGVAEALGAPFLVKDIRYNRWGGLHNLVRSDSRRGLTRICRKALSPPWPHLVIGAGRRTAPLVRWFKRKFASHAVQIMDPGWPGRDEFDLIAIPAHDETSPRRNILATPGSCHRASAVRLAAEAARWRDRLAGDRPILLLAVGGATRERSFGAAMAERLAQEAGKLAGQLGACLHLVTSRRTGPMIENILAGALPGDSRHHFWGEDSENPYLGLLALAEAVVVTGDSMNMCSEACANGGPVYVFAPEGLVNARHARLHDYLYRHGYARPLGSDPTPWRHPPLDASATVAAAIRERGLV